MLIILFFSVFNFYKFVFYECFYLYKFSFCVGVIVFLVLVIWLYIVQLCLRYFLECFFMVRLYCQIDFGLVFVLFFCDVCVRVIVVGLVVCCLCYIGFFICWYCGLFFSCVWFQLGLCYLISCICIVGFDDIDFGCLVGFI